LKTYSSEILANYIRAYSLKMVHKAGTSHIGGALSMTDILAVLYQDVLNYNPLKSKALNRDRFILSKGHCCVALYSVLALKNFFDIKELENFTLPNSNLMSHINHKVPGVEFSTGSLGHGLPFAVGKALKAKINNKKWQVFVILSDGELDEGSNWEALMFASHHKLDNLNIIIDYNKLQSLTTVKETINIESLYDKFNSFGCFTEEINGHNHSELKKVLSKKNKILDKPKVVVAHTIKGKGVSFMENKVEWHYKHPTDNQFKQALKEIGIIL
jgi:transketolase